MSLSNWFLPHKETHQKATLISWEGFVIYILIFILLQVGFSIISYSKPGVLGISSSIDQKKLIELTNAERQKQGLPAVAENEALDKAAALKAQNMFAENYWAHFAPSGKTPWDFILGAGYKFTYAGENLAKNFYQSDDVVSAWMNSKTHRENLLNPKYKDIGIAVVEGNLNGQKTTLVVQEFGTTEMLSGNPAVEISGKQITVPGEALGDRQAGGSGVLIADAPLLVGAETNPLLDPYQIYKWGGISIISLIAGLLVVDLIALKRRGVFRISSHHIAHMGLLSLTASSLMISSPGAIL